MPLVKQWLLPRVFSILFFSALPFFSLPFSALPFLGVMSGHMVTQMGPMNLLKFQSLIGSRQSLLANLSIAIEEFSRFPSESVFVV